MGNILWKLLSHAYQSYSLPNKCCCYIIFHFTQIKFWPLNSMILLLSTNIWKYPHYSFCVWKSGGVPQFTTFFITTIKYSIKESFNFLFTTKGITYQNYHMWLLSEPLQFHIQKRKIRHANIILPSLESSANQLKPPLCEIEDIMQKTTEV